ncbi:hypothetical protein H8D79_01665, partial [PVC group bacterium]|nr:hypothetical protein [PVC group bacterium]
LGRYHLYFAHHQGKFIRLAYADALAGPWTVYEPGVLHLDDTPYGAHLASPDVHIDHERRRFFMYYHGCRPMGGLQYPGGQTGCYAESEDGLTFTSYADNCGPPYMRVFEWDGWFYSFSGGGARVLHRCPERDGLFAPGPTLDVSGESFTDMETHGRDDPQATPVYRMRHVCVHRRGARLHIYVSNAGDRPERIRRTTVDLSQPWTEWCGTPLEEVLRSEMGYEGVSAPLVASEGGASHVPVHQVRDPHVYQEGDDTYLVYSVAGERGLAIARISE